VVKVEVNKDGREDGDEESDEDGGDGRAEAPGEPFLRGRSINHVVGEKSPKQVNLRGVGRILVLIFMRSGLTFREMARLDSSSDP